MKLTRRKVVLGVVAAVPAWILGRPLVHLARTALSDGPGLPPPAPGKLDDASRLDERTIARVVEVKGPVADAERTIAEAFTEARAKKLPVSVAGARHAMGAHSLAKDGLVLDMTGVAHVAVDEATSTMTVGAGARWHDLIEVLDPRGLAIAVMQSNDGFSVGGSLSVNCHGWQPNRPPIASTVQALRVVRPDGTAVDLRPGDELFGLVLGGYGLFGVIVEAKLRVVKNEAYLATRHELAARDYAATFARVATGDDVGLAFGRLSVDPEAFLEDALLTVYRTDTSVKTLPPASAREGSKLARTLFRGEVESAYGKHLRWSLEKHFGSEGGASATRNQLLHEPVAQFQNRRPELTDVLHEYFVPAASFADFVADLKRIVPSHAVDLLNVTVRNVTKDAITFLPYATEDVFSLVLLFSQRRTDEAESAMRAATVELVDAALARGGRHYLPYRPHPTRAQVVRGYANWDAMVAAKRRIDPDLILRNGFWDAYAT